MLYPEATSIYAFPNGSTQEVPCFIPGKAEVQKADCPYPFVNPIADDHPESCIQPCPPAAYTDNEYTVMWAAANSIGLIGLCLNIFMACTWLIGGRRFLSDQPYQLKFCVFAGILHGAVETLPSLALKYNLACGCQTEEW